MNHSEQKAARILICDDDNDTLEMIYAAVSAMGFEVVRGTNGLEAVELFKSCSPDLVLLDFSMPGQTGPQACLEIKKLSKDLVPVIILTARTEADDKVTAFEGGADDYLVKPFNFKELKARIDAHLRIRKLNLELHRKNQELLELQDRLVQQERQILVNQISGTAAHKLGQPLSAIMLNSHLLEMLPKTDGKFKTALEAIKSDSKRMADIIEQLKSVDANSTKDYHGGTRILEVPKKKR